MVVEHVREKKVDSFRYLSRLISRYYRLTQIKPEFPIPWSPLEKPLTESIFGLVTSGGLYHKGHEPPFDLERERLEPTWGDPSYRTIPSDIDPSELGVSHYHINNQAVLSDMNILLPIERFRELGSQGKILGLGRHNYSFMGYQGFPADLSGWKNVYGPRVADELISDGVDCVLLTAA